MQQLQNFIFYVVFQQALMFYNKWCNFSCATTVKMLYNKNQKHNQNILLCKRYHKPSQQHMKPALKFDILHLIASQIVI
jgi:hypothetical protein